MKIYLQKAEGYFTLSFFRPTFWRQHLCHYERSPVDDCNERWIFHRIWIFGNIAGKIVEFAVLSSSLTALVVSPKSATPTKTISCSLTLEKVWHH